MNIMNVDKLKLQTYFLTPQSYDDLAIANEMHADVNVYIPRLVLHHWQLQCHSSLDIIF